MSKQFNNPYFPQQVNITDYIVDNRFPIQSNPIIDSYTISTDHNAGLTFLRSLQEISPILNGIVMELLVDFSITEHFYIHTNHSKEYSRIAKLLAKDIDETFFSSEPLYSNDISNILVECETISNDHYHESYLSDHTIPQDTVFYMLIYVRHILGKFNKNITHSVITDYFQTIIHNWKYFEDLCTYMFCIQPILTQYINSDKIKTRFALPCGFRTKKRTYFGEIDILMNDVIIDIKCAKHPRYDQWSRQLHMYAYGMNTHNGLLTVSYDLCVINVYANEILFFDNIESFDIESFEI